jgi:hypothetical protein
MPWIFEIQAHKLSDALCLFARVRWNKIKNKFWGRQGNFSGMGMGMVSCTLNLSLQDTLYLPQPHSDSDPERSEPALGCKVARSARCCLSLGVHI